MNEILYRGKSIAENEWIYGYYVKVRGDSFPRIYIGWNCWTLTPEWLFVEVDTVGQYSGLTDKNGEKVFKGDIICDPDFPDTLYTVVVNDFAFCAKSIGSQEMCFLRDFIIFGEAQICVVGNIYDNSELLEVKN